MNTIRPISTVKLPAQNPDPHWLPMIAAQIESLEFGEVQVVVHDSRIVQLEVTKKIRFDKNGLPILP